MTDQAGAPDEGADSFPRRYARTQRFTLGAPRTFSVTGDGERVLFVRSQSGTDRTGCLWALDLSSGEERLLLDPAAVLASVDEELSPAERARRERMREQGAGVVGYALDRAGRMAALALSSRLWTVDVAAGQARELPAAGPVLDPRPDPTGRRVAYVSGGALHTVGVDGSEARMLAGPESPTTTWGLAEFVAAEEMDRARGYWWAPDGEAVLAAEVDVAPVQVWHIAAPEQPDRAPVAVRYPAAGTANAEVRLFVLALDGSRTEVGWDRDAYEYVTTAGWDELGPWLRVMSRDQRRALLLAVQPDTGATSVVTEQSDPVWLDVVPGTPARTPDGRLVDTVDDGDTRRLSVAGSAVTPPGLQVGAVLDVDDDRVVVSASTVPTERHVWTVAIPAGSDASLRRLTDEPGVHGGVAEGDGVVLASTTLEQPGSRVRVLRGGSEVARITTYADTPPLRAAPVLLVVGEHELQVGVLYPRDHVPGRRLPVLMDPYGGPHHQEVVAAHNIWLEPQWFADQGFAVVVADGRGTGGRGPRWDRAVHHRFADVTLEDQVRALEAVAREHPDLDTARVGIRGWSYGGYLAALAVLRRPDVFSAGVAGAPVTDWRLYDTFYTERYLGHPDQEPDVYEQNSLLADAAALTRPLLLIHGLADDNVVAAHSLRLSSALLAGGRPHEFLPLSGVTHMTPQEVVAENLMLLQVDFLRRHLGRSGASDAAAR